MASTRRRRSPTFSVKLAVLAAVVIIVASFAYLQAANLYGGRNGGLLIDWRMKLVFEDVRTGVAVNYTLPAGIGTPGGLWSNHTLDYLGWHGYSPLSTRDGTSTVWIQATQPGVFSFGDFFNVWGQTFNSTCVPNLGPSGGLYCARAAEPLVYDNNSDMRYEPGTDTLVQVISQFNVSAPPSGASLSIDRGILFACQFSSCSNWNSSDPIIYDQDHDGVYNNSTDPVIYLHVIPGTAAHPPPNGITLRLDPKLLFYDSDHNGRWDSTAPSPVLSDGTKERCTSSTYGLSNNKEWTVFLWSNLALAEQLGCASPG